MNKVGIIGLGETGATILSLLNERYKNLTFNVYDPSEWISGRLYDLKHAAAYNNNSISLNDFSSSKDCEYIFFCAGFRNSKGTDRMEMIEQNKSLISSIFNDVKLAPNTVIINLTNPVELITEWISEFLNNEYTVIGTGTGLDYYRLKSIVSEKTGVPTSKIDIPVVGEHGKDMLPLYSIGKIDDKSVDDFFNESELQELTQTLRDVAKTIRKTEDATKYGVAQCAVDLLSGFENESGDVYFVSRFLDSNLKNRLGVSDDIFLSLPTILKDKKVQTVSLQDINEDELSQLKSSAQKLIDVFKSSS